MKCLRNGLRSEARENERFPMKSDFFFDTTQLMPRSCGVTVPSVSWPMIGYPFSARNTCMVSVPYGVIS
ncbi:Uncharacterised protein [Mycobacteroides abscessus subsp. abscessus]|nr:Uncharacterised protein [Mycobacteroides abscessus subsp. abscessus]